ncbi:MAG TPA: choice-of-anchor Q domain-containing protein, partial [Anaerolineaceae bacterium]|nr:choice-of-anchor Q domain-containing protein [Anaerolineaceae bacterium]
MALTHRPTRSFIHLALCLIVAAGFLAARPVPAAQAGSYDLYVNVAEDWLADYQQCTEGWYGYEDCSLRGAINKANSDPTHRYTIHLKPLGQGEVYALIRPGTGEDGNLTGDLDITTNLAIYGNGATIDANGIDRVIDFSAPAPGVDVYPALIRDLTITGGHAPGGANGTAGNPDGGSGQNGGAIRIRNGEIRLVAVTVAGNQAGAGGNGRDGLGVYEGTGENGGKGGTGGSGGGIYVASTGRLRTDTCRVLDNHAGTGGAGGEGGWGTEGHDAPGNGGRGGDGGMAGYGGGVYAETGSYVLLERTNFEHNTAGGGGNGGRGGDGSMGSDIVNGGNGGPGGHGGIGGSGGAVYAATLDVSHSLYFAENAAGKAGDGGAGGRAGVGRYDGADGATQAGSKGGLGGAILADDVSDLKLNFTTIVYNTTGSHGTGFVPATGQFFGGGISARGLVALKNSIVYFNTAAGTSSPDNCHRYYSEEVQYTGGHNLLQAADGCEFEPIESSTPGDIIGRDPRLATDQTPPEPWMAPIALQPGSPAIDQIPAAECIDWDTQGYSVTTDHWKQGRPSGFACDIGAYEFPF